MEYNGLKTADSQHEWYKRTVESLRKIGVHARACARWCKTTEENGNVNIFKRQESIMKYIKDLVPNFAEKWHKLLPTDEFPFDLPQIQALCKSTDPIDQYSLAPLQGLLTQSFGRTVRLHEHEDTRVGYMLQRNVLIEIYKNAIESVDPFRMHDYNQTYPSLAEVYVLTDRLDMMDYSKAAEGALSVPFDGIVDLWKEDVNSKLIQLIRDECGPEYVFDPDTVLNLASTFFTCNCVSKRKDPFPLRYKQAMGHRCYFSPGLRHSDGMECFQIFGFPIWGFEHHARSCEDVQSRSASSDYGRYGQA
ncbi:hypothetical protein BDN70DRAFT_300118 [Pholiota conissans]|uniref:Uncharacterized protein n=1 Tax=Pholiota conissans TaxID=109636 RepID=A0A9P5YRR3_9AGAR|nr:hypothetical protein BDN70DRAFT_300118 [Pholiota conissans]